MKPRYAWTDLPVLILGVILLIPLVVHLVGLVFGFVEDGGNFAP